MCRHDVASLFVLFRLLHVELTVFDTRTINSYAVSLLRKLDRCSPVLCGKLPLAEHFGLFGKVNLFLLACHPRTRQTKVLLMLEPLSSTTSFAPRILNAQTGRSWVAAHSSSLHSQPSNNPAGMARSSSGEISVPVRRFATEGQASTLANSGIISISWVTNPCTK